MHKKNNKSSKNNDKNLVKEMAYELAGDIGALDNEDMLKNRNLVPKKKSQNYSKKK